MRTVTRRTQEELDALLDALPVVTNSGCGHQGVSADAYYGGNRGRICVSCYRETERIRQQSYRAASAVGTAFSTLNHAVRKGAALTDDERTALAILREARAARKGGTAGYVYLICERWNDGRASAFKVGFSVDPEARVGELQTGNCRPLELLAKKPGTLSDEASLHKSFSEHHIQGEWFRPSQDVASHFGVTL